MRQNEFPDFFQEVNIVLLFKKDQLFVVPPVINMI